MKQFFLAACLLFSVSAFAQKNTLLDQSFWKTTPDVAAVKAEIEKGSNPSQFNGANFDPVVMAINSQAPDETILFLLSQPGNGTDKITHDSRTYLHWAAMRGNVIVMEYLVSKGAKANVDDSHGSTPLNFAAGGGQQDTRVYDICLANGGSIKDVDHDGANALLISIASDKDFKLTNYFVSKGLDLKSVDANGNNAFSYAARGGNIELMKSLVQKGIPAKPSAMLMAAQGGRGKANSLEVFQYLESLNIKPSVTGKHGENALHSLVRRPNQNAIVDYFLEKGTDVNQADEDGNTVFMNAAASNSDTVLLEKLAAKTKNINQQNSKGVSALMLAVRGNAPATVAYLIGKGADINAVDKNGDNLGYYLVQSYSPQRAADFETKTKLLTDKGVKLAATQENGNTLYHVAVTKNDLNLVKKLAPLGIDINAKNKEGLTALHKAAMVSKDDEMMKYLISIGAKKDILTSFEESAFDLAGENESLSKNNVAIHFLK